MVIHVKKEKKLNSYVTPLIRIKHCTRAGGRDTVKSPFKHGNDRPPRKHTNAIYDGRVLTYAMFTADVPDLSTITVNKPRFYKCMA